MKKVSRRTFLYSAGMMGGLMGGGGESIVNKINSYANPPIPIRPGVWSTYATVCRECPAGCGMHLRFRDGRVTKAEGNPMHPVNQGSLCSRGQSCVQGLYDPDRLQSPLHRAMRSSALAAVGWDEALERIGGLIGKRGARTVLVSDIQTGSLAGLMKRFCTACGSDRMIFYEPLGCDALRSAHNRLFGLDSIPAYRFELCDFILSFAADFLETWISPVEFTRGFADMHALKDGSMGRFVYAGPRLSMTAANADDCFLVPPGSERFIALAMVDAMVQNGWAKNDAATVRAVAETLGSREAMKNAPLAPDQITRLARSFAEARASVALAGPLGATGGVAKDTATAAALLNYAAGRIGQTVDFSSPHALSSAGSAADLKSLADRVSPDDVVIIHSCNLAFTNKKIMDGLRRAGTIVYLTTLPDETAEAADWVLPIDSPLESFGDYEPRAGIHGLMQPTMRRLYDTRAPGDIIISLARAAGHPLDDKDYRQTVRDYWRSLDMTSGSEPFEGFRERSLRTGGHWATPPAVKVTLKPGRIQPFTPAPVPGQSIELSLSPSPVLYDGRVANRGWMQEAPHPVSGEVWGSSVAIHPDTARALAVRKGEVVEVKSASGSCRLPVSVTADVVAGCAAIMLGQGHTAGKLTNAVRIGANGFDLWDREESGNLFCTVTVTATGAREQVVSAGGLHDQFSRAIVQAIGLSVVRTMRPGEGDRLTLPLPEGYDKNRDLIRPQRPSIIAGAWLRICTGVPGAAPAPLPARRKTIFRLSAKRRSGTAGKWHGSRLRPTGSKGLPRNSAGCRSSASSATPHPAKPCARSSRRTITRRGSTARFTIDVSALVTARITVPTRSAGSTGKTPSGNRRSTSSSTPK